MKVAYGIFMWDGTERRSNRYGFVYAGDSTFEGDVTVTPTIERLVRNLEGHRVKITCKVLESRESGHAGDKFLLLSSDDNDYLKPTRPQAGEEVVLGVGVLALDKDYTGNHVSFGLFPSDSRETFWYDPRKLYRLHDQTVEIHIEESDEPDHVVEPFIDRDVSSNALISNDDGSFQCKNTNIKRIAPQITNHGDGLYEVRFGAEDNEVYEGFE